VSEPVSPAGAASGVLGALPDAVVALDAAGVIRWLGGAPDTALGWEASRLVGRPVFELFAKKANDDLHRRALATIATAPGVYGPVEVTVVAADGRLREVELMVSNALDVPGVEALVATVRDITDRDRESEHFRQLDAWATALLRTSAELFLVSDRTGRLAYASPSAQRLLGFAPQELVGRSIVDLVHPEDVLDASSGAPVDRVLGTGPGRRPTVRLATAEGWKRMRLERTTGEELGDHLLLITARELTHEHDAASLLSEQTLVLERIARGAPVVDSLRALALMAQRRMGDGSVLVGFVDQASFDSVAPGVDDDLVKQLERLGVSRPPLAASPAAVDPGFWRLDGWDPVVRGASGGRWASAWVAELVVGDEVAGRVVALRPDNGPLPAEVADLLNLVVDLATIAVERHQLQARLAHGALHDELTGLPNRRYLLGRLDDAFSRPGAQAGLLFIDLDRFKVINDSLGHEAGDHLLAEVTDRFRRALRPADLVARVGGDEFVVLCPDLEGPEAVAGLAARLTESLADPIDLPGGRVVVSASIGVVHATGPADPAELLQDADLAMYDAKEAGRNRTAVFHAGLRERAVARLEVETALRDALRADEMTLHYQPVVRLEDGAMVGVEALLRWDRPGVGLVRPGAFVPVATDTGLILPLGRWVIQQATQAGARWPGLEVAANLSARQLADDGLVDFVAECLDRSGVAAGRLCLEVTEADLVTDVELVALQLQRFKDLGVRLAIDDFGTGFATLDYLRRFANADVLKVDASFVAGLTDPASNDLAIVSAALVLADNLGFETVAEGVETEAQRDVLVRLGCELAQGHLFSPPVEAEAIDRLVLGADLPVGGGRG
jgi:diguanylate cyclase (GGDEF)-like protein/PAS domain S-box-containing protein